MHDPDGLSTVKEVTDGCTDTATGPLETPAAVAMMVAVPLIGFPSASEPLHTTKIESHTPAHTWPDGEMVATAVFDELKENVVLTVVFAELTAETVRGTTSPATRENDAGLTLTAATVLFVEEEPPQPAMNERKRTIMANPVSSWRQCLIPCVLRRTWMRINIEESSV